MRLGHVRPDYDWGQVPGQAHSASVAGVSAVAFATNYRFGFTNTILTGHLNGAHVVVDDFNVFTDGSGRSPYFTTFKRPDTAWIALH
jgi:hypothetical protein